MPLNPWKATGHPRGVTNEDGERYIARQGIPWGQETLSQLGGRVSPNKDVLQEQVGRGNEEPNDSGEVPEEGGSSQGKDKVDETDNDVDSEAVTPSMAATRHGTQLAEQDQQEFPLTGGKWVGKGPYERWQKYE